MTDIETAPPTPPGTPLFHATITPHRSLGPKGIALVVGGATMASLVLAVPFIVAGAWPVGGFLGLDVALLYLAFRINARRAGAFEDVMVSRIDLVLRKVSWRGAVREWRFNPRWVRVLRQEDEEFGLLRLAIADGRREVSFGDCLAPVERADLAAAFSRALSEARR